MASREKVDQTMDNKGQEGAAPSAGAGTQRRVEPQPGGPTQAALRPYMDKLRAEYARLRGEHADLEDTGLHSNLVDETGEIYAADNHPGDMGTEVFLHERDMALEENLEDIMRQCERALQKIEERTYGYSDVSGAFIGEERLDAVPYATLTVQEQERLIEG